MLQRDKILPAGFDPLEIKTNFDKLAGDHQPDVKAAENFFVKAKEAVERLLVRWWLYTDFADKEKIIHQRIRNIFALRKVG